ncbi:hypothetical protein [Streptomyces rimosus]|uniref:hypothetical protein n=1 Tax=Streptomyces rimosus TaxID=1927 RepID=UPI0037D4AA3B
MRWRAMGLTGAVLVAMSVTTTGCGRYFACGEEGTRPAGLTREDLVGSYRADPFGAVELKADGTFTATDWPDFEKSHIDPAHVGGVTGKWQLEPEDQRIGTDSDVHLTFRGTGEAGRSGVPGIGASEKTAYSRGFSVAGSRSQPRLYRFATDPDICTFHTLQSEGAR